MLRNNTQQNISQFSLLLPIIIVASKFIRWNFMLMNLVYMSIGWGMAERIVDGRNWPGLGAGILLYAEWFFDSINFLNITTFVGWEVFFTIVYNILFAILIVNFYKKNPYVGTKENIFIYLNMALLNIYCFTMSKECYQVLFWFILAWCITSRTGYKKKMVALLIGLVFTFSLSRKYYALVGLYYVVIQFYVTTFFRTVDTSTAQGRSKLLQNILGLVVIFGVAHFFFMGFMESANQEQYEELVRVNTREGSEAQSEIAPIFKGNRLMMTFDYLIKIFRLALPIELLLKAKPSYLITILYQSLLVLFLFNALKYRNKSSIEELEKEAEEERVEDEDEEEEELALATNQLMEEADEDDENEAVTKIEDEDEDDDENEDEDDDEDEKITVIPETRDRIDTRTIALFTYLGFLLCSAMFEPDFGSWLRHQCVALPIIIYIL